MKRYPLFLLLPVWGILLQSHVAADVLFDRDVPQVAFAAAELSDAMTETGRDNLKVTIVIDSAQSNPEAFQIRVAGWAAPTMLASLSGTCRMNIYADSTWAQTAISEGVSLSPNSQSWRKRPRPGRRERTRSLRLERIDSIL